MYLQPICTTITEIREFYVLKLIILYKIQRSGRFVVISTHINNYFSPSENNIPVKAIQDLAQEGANSNIRLWRGELQQNLIVLNTNFSFIFSTQFCSDPLPVYHVFSCYAYILIVQSYAIILSQYFLSVDIYVAPLYILVLCLLYMFCTCALHSTFPSHFLHFTQIHTLSTRVHVK